MAPSATLTGTPNLFSSGSHNGDRLPVARTSRVRSCASVERLACIVLSSS